MANFLENFKNWFRSFVTSPTATKFENKTWNVETLTPEPGQKSQNGVLGQKNDQLTIT